MSALTLAFKTTGAFTSNIENLNLHNEVDESFVIVAGHWCVRTHNQITINPGREINMLALRKKDREKEHFTINTWYTPVCTSSICLLQVWTAVSRDPITSGETLRFTSGNLRLKRVWFCDYTYITCSVSRLMHGKCKKGTITIIIIAIIIDKINKLYIFIITIIIMLAEAIFMW